MSTVRNNFYADNPSVLATCYLDNFQAIPDASTAKIALLVHDRDASALTNALPIMQKYKFPMTLVAPTGFGALTVTQLQNMYYQYGCDIVTHGIDHSDETTLTTQQLQYTYSSSQNWIKSNGLGDGWRFYLPSLYSWNTTTISNIGTYFYAAHPIAQPATANMLYNSIPASNPMMLTGLSMLNTTSLATVQAYIDKIAANNAFGIIDFHQITDSYSVQTSITTTLFDQICAYIQSTGVEVVTFSQYFDNNMD
jgi:peptidoglycan/xylan/chitin deacetylase (PgdA/CDA1 family)